MIVNHGDLQINYVTPYNPVVSFKLIEIGKLKIVDNHWLFVAKDGAEINQTAALRLYSFIEVLNSKSKSI